MPVEFDRESPRKFDSRTLNRKTLDRWTGRNKIERSKFNDSLKVGRDVLTGRITSGLTVHWTRTASISHDALHLGPVGIR